MQVITVITASICIWVASCCQPYKSLMVTCKGHRLLQYVRQSATLMDLQCKKFDVNLESLCDSEILLAT